MDSHDRDKNGASVHYNGDGVYWGKFNDEQKEWYEHTVRIMKDDGCWHVVFFAHIPVAAYNYAFNAAIKKEYSNACISTKESYDGVYWNDGYKTSVGVKREEICSNPNDKFLDTILKTGVWTTLVAGHNHINNFIIDYKGTTFAYALKTGKGCYAAQDLNGGTVIKISDDGVKTYHEYVKTDE